MLSNTIRVADIVDQSQITPSRFGQNPQWRGLAIANESGDVVTRNYNMGPTGGGTIQRPGYPTPSNPSGTYGTPGGINAGGGYNSPANPITNQPGWVVPPANLGDVNTPGNTGSGPSDNGNGGNSPTTGNSGDPIEEALLAALLSGQGGSSVPQGLGTPVGTIGPGTTATSSGAGAAILLILIALAVGGWFIWKHYKKKIEKEA